MDYFLLILGIICCFVGLIGSFLPVLPGPSISWVGLLLLYLTNTVPNNYWFLGVVFVLMATITMLDYIIPSKGTKKFGGTKFGVWGTNIGLIIGLFFPPFGFILGPFFGAFFGEMIKNSSDTKGALKSASGSLIGLIVSSFMKFIFCFSILMTFFFIAFKYFF